MKDIQDLHVIQIRIFPIDIIPYEMLSVSEKRKIFREKLHFSSEEIPFPLLAQNTPNVISFKSGECDLKQRKIIITRLNLEDRKIVLEVQGDSGEADAAFKTISSNLNELIGKDIIADEKAILKNQETKCVVSLDIDFWNVFSDKMKNFIKDDFLQMFQFPLLSLDPRTLSFEATFKQLDPLQEEKINLSPKRIIIEPRAGTPFKNQIFFTQTPFDSETHLKIIKSFEKLFALKDETAEDPRKKSGKRR